jgi:hypothetical protein
MPDDVILKSASFDPAGEAGREEHLVDVLERNGLEVKTPPEEESSNDTEEREIATPFGPLPAKKSRRARAIEKATTPLLERIKQLETAQPAVAAQAEDPQVAQRRQTLQKYAAGVKEAKSRYSDWDETVNQDLHIGVGSQLALLEIENGPEVVYYLGKHPDVARKLGQMSHSLAAAEVGRISERLAGASRSRPRVPAPVRTVSTAGSSVAPSPSDIASRPNYPGKAKDFRRALSER